MSKIFTLDYWKDDGWFVGRLRENPSVFSQGETFEELKENIADAYKLVVQESMEELRTPHESVNLALSV